MSACISWNNALVERQRNRLKAIYKRRMKIRTKWIKDFCSNTYEVTSAYITGLSRWSAVKGSHATQLQEFSIAFEQARNALKGMQYMKDSRTANVLRQFWERLPRCLRSKWTEIARLGVTQDRQPTSTTSASLCPNKPIW